MRITQSMKQHSLVFKEIIVELRATLGELVTDEELMRLSQQLIANALDTFSLDNDIDVDLDINADLEEQYFEGHGLYVAPLDVAFSNEWEILQFENQQGNREVDDDSESIEKDRYEKIRNILRGS